MEVTSVPEEVCRDETREECVSRPQESCQDVQVTSGDLDIGRFRHLDIWTSWHLYI